MKGWVSFRVSGPVFSRGFTEYRVQGNRAYGVMHTWSAEGSYSYARGGMRKPPVRTEVDTYYLFLCCCFLVETLAVV
jgi:hypothetical protein